MMAICASGAITNPFYIKILILKFCVTYHIQDKLSRVFSTGPGLRQSNFNGNPNDGH